MIFDYTYLLFVLPAIIFAMIASAKVNSAFNKYSKQMSARGITGREAAERVLRANGVVGIKIERVSGNLTDHYDPKTNVIRLSDNVYDSTSTAAIGVAAHEAGHAVQHEQEYAPAKIRMAIVPVTNIGSKLSIPLILLGIILSLFASERFLIISYIGIACFTLCAVFQLVTLPTEYDASHRAIAALESGGILDDEEIKGAKKVLSAAALTYVAALAVTLMQLLRLLVIVGRYRRD